MLVIYLFLHYRKVNVCGLYSVCTMTQIHSSNCTPIRSWQLHTSQTGVSHCQPLYTFLRLFVRMTKSMNLLLLCQMMLYVLLLHHGMYNSCLHSCISFIVAFQKSSLMIYNSLMLYSGVHIIVKSESALCRER